MYNIAKVAKGEILIYFNEIFDALCKVGSRREPSVPAGLVSPPRVLEFDHDLFPFPARRRLGVVGEERRRTA